MLSTDDFVRQHDNLRGYIQAGDKETFRRELLKHERQEERAIFCWLRPVLDAMQPPWLERSLLWYELLELLELGESGVSQLEDVFGRLTRLEEEVLFPLAERLR